MMQTDVKTYHTQSSGAQQVVSGRCRLRGYQVAPSGTAGQLNFYDGTSTSDPLILSLDITANTAIISTTIPAEGIVFTKGIYYSPASANTTTFTVFYS